MDGEFSGGLNCKSKGLCRRIRKIRPGKVDAQDSGKLPRFVGANPHNPTMKQLCAAGFTGTLLLFLFSQCNILGKNLNNADLARFKASNQIYLDSMARSASQQAAMGFADSARLISQNLIIGLKGVMDTLDPDFKKLEYRIAALGKMSRIQLDSLGQTLEARLDGLKDNVKDEELKKFLISIIEESTGSLKKQTKSMLSDMIQKALDDFDAETAREKVQLIVRGALDDSTQVLAQELVHSALQPTVDSIMGRIEKLVRKDVPFVQRQAQQLLIALGLVAIAIIGWFWYQRRRYARLVGLLTYQIDKIPSQELYDELTKRIRNEAQQAELEPLLRQTLKEQGINE